MKLKYYLFLASLLCVLSTFSQETPNENDSCHNALPFCSDQTYSFPAGVNSGNAQVGPNYSCLSSQPNPAWYFMQIGTGGDIFIKMQSNPSKDIDFICWGPFPSPTAACNGGLTGDKMVDCSYSGASIEYCEIYAAVAGQFYILLITNFSEQNCQITFSQTNIGTPGAGMSNCNIVLYCSMLSVTPVATTCNATTNTYDVSGNVEFSNPPPTGTMTISDVTAVPPVTQTFTPPFNSPQSFLLTGISCDNAIHTIVASFSDSASCNLTELYNSPPPSCPIATISGGGQICSGATIPVNISISGAPPFDFIYAIQGVPQPAVTNYSGPFPYQINASVSGSYTLVSVLNSFCASGTTLGSATVTVHPLPVPTITGTASACLNSNQNYVTQPGMTGYTWNIPAGGSISSGSGTNSVIVNWTSTGTNTITVNYNDIHSCAAAAPISFAVQVNPLPIPVIAGNSLVCPGIPEVYSTTAGMTNYVWNVPAGGTIISGGTAIDPTATVVWNNTGVNSITLKYTNSDGCTSGLPSIYNVIVKPLPVVPKNISSICSGTATSINLTSSIPGSTFIWTTSASSASISGNSGGTGNQIIQVIFNSSFNTGFVVYSVIATSDGCIGLVTSDTVYIKPLPNVSFLPASPVICGGQTTNISLSSSVASSSFSWTAIASSPAVTGFASGSGNTISQTLGTPGINIETVTYTITPVAKLCAGPPINLQVLINPKPHLVTDPMFQTICSEGITNISLSSSCTGTAFTWTPSVFLGNVTGMSAGSGPVINQTLTNLLSTQSIINYTIGISTASCIGNDSLFVVSIDPKPHILTQNPDTMICSGGLTGIHLNSDVTGSTYSWTATGSSSNVSGFTAGSGNQISQNLINTGYTDETVSYSIIAQANGCGGFLLTYNVIVHPVADVYFAPVAQTICSGTPSNLSLLSNVLGTIYTWSAIGSSGNVNGFSTGSGNTIAQILNNTGTNQETVTYTVSPTANSCSGTSSVVIVTVNPVAHLITNPIVQVNCSGSLFSFNLTADVTVSTYTWIATPTSANILGYSSGSGNIISQSIINTGFDIDSVIYSVTPSAYGCSGVPSNYFAIINPVPDLSNNPLSADICSGNSTNLVLTSNITGTTFSWTCTPGSANITGYSPGNGLSINQILTNLGLTPEFVTYNITPSANGCSGIETGFNVNITEVPDVYFNPPAQTVCSLQGANISILSHVGSTTFTWTASGSSANVTGFSGGTGNVIAQTLENTGNNFETVTYTATPNAFGCPSGLPVSVVVTVNPKPAISNTLTSFAICSASATSISLSSTQPSTTYVWTATGSSPSVTGFNNGNGSLIAQILINSGFNNETVSYIVIPEANSCFGDPFTFNVTVYPVADVIFTPASQSLCSGFTTAVDITSNVSGSSYSWTATPSSFNVNGYSSGSGNLIQQLLNNTGHGIDSVTYNVVPIANGCTGTPKNVVVKVFPNPSVTYTACFDPVTTTDAKPVKLTGGSPAGGIWTGNGVGSGYFNPGFAGQGIHIITYTFLNTWGCINSASQPFTVVAPLIFACGDILTDIRDNKIYPTVSLGARCWMATNLNYGNAIQSSLMQRENCVSEKYCFGDNILNCDIRGGLYQWDEMMKHDDTQDSQGLCPPSWHIPSESEWNSLFTTFVDKGFAGSPLKASGFSGFNAILYGSRFCNVHWDYDSFASIFWSSTKHGTFKAWAHGMNTPNPSVSTYPGYRSNAFSVRCIKD